LTILNLLFYRIIETSVPDRALCLTSVMAPASVYGTRHMSLVRRDDMNFGQL